MSAEQEAAAKLLLETSDRGLLTTFASLTHQIHAISSEAEAKTAPKTVRAQRDVVENEILRRMSAASVVERARGVVDRYREEAGTCPHVPECGEVCRGPLVPS